MASTLDGPHGNPADAGAVCSPPSALPAIAMNPVASSQTTSPHGWLDFSAIVLSGLCLVHCLAIPLLAVLLPILVSGPWADERVHLWLLAAVVPTSVMAFWLGLRRHHRVAIVVLGSTGLSLVAAAALGRNAGLFGETGDRWLTVCGGLLLALAHWRNYQLMHAGHRHGLNAEAVTVPPVGP